MESEEEEDQNFKEIAGGRGLTDLYKLPQDRSIWRATAVYPHEHPVR